MTSKNILDKEAERFCAHVSNLSVTTGERRVDFNLSCRSVSASIGPGNPDHPLDADSTARALEWLEGGDNAELGGQFADPHLLRGTPMADRMALLEALRRHDGEAAIENVFLKPDPLSPRHVRLTSNSVVAGDDIGRVRVVWQEYRPAEREKLIWQAMAWCTGAALNL